MRTMVEVFNQLTHSELVDCSLLFFEDLLGNHFQKFRYYYENISDIPNDVSKTVKAISCSCTNSSILIVTEFKSAKNCSDYREHLEDLMDTSSFLGDKYFSFSTEIKGDKKLNISIENKGISREDEIYEDRFNSN
jgi:hypothetical protein